MNGVLLNCFYALYPWVTKSQSEQLAIDLCYWTIDVFFACRFWIFDYFQFIYIFERKTKVHDSLYPDDQLYIKISITVKLIPVTIEHVLRS